MRPGWVALLIVLALGAATVLLWRNMGKQLKKIDFDGDDDGADAPSTVRRPASTDSSAGPGWRCRADGDVTHAKPLRPDRRLELRSMPKATACSSDSIVTLATVATL